MSEVKDRRWNDPFDPDDGLRVLICRLRPRGVAKRAETWHRWERALAPSLELLKAFQGKQGPALAWTEYRRRFLAELDNADAHALLAALAAIVQAGRPVTLLCASACVDRARCHRSLVRALIEERLSVVP